MKIHENVEQASQAWFALRLGVITASEAGALVTPLWKLRKGDGVDTYLYRKLAEKVLNYSPDQLNTFGMDQGKLVETIAVPWFEFAHGKKVKRVGFCATDDGVAGCSPDGMLADGSGLEIKSPQAPNHIRYLMEGTVPEDYRVQVQFSLWVTKAPYWTFVSYSMVLPALVIRVEPDPQAQEAISQAVAAFSVQFAAGMKRITEIKDSK